MGVIDGHDVKALRRALGEALKAERPVVVHIHTVKGKGFAPAEEGGLEGMEKWHAAKPGSIKQGMPVGSSASRPGPTGSGPGSKKASPPKAPLSRPEYQDAKPAREGTDDVRPEPKPPAAPPQYT